MAPTQQRVKAAGRWLVSVGGTATPGELGEELGGLNSHQQAAVTKALLSAGLTTGPKGRLSLTPAGWAAFAAVGPVAAGEVLDGLVAEVYPDQFYAHRAWQRLLTSATVARWHLWEGRPEHHFTFVAEGAEGTAKTAPFVLACEMLNVDPQLAIVGPDDETAAGIGGRQKMVVGSVVVRDTPELAGLPLVLFDDADKMAAAERMAFWPYLSGKIRHRGRQLRPTAVVTYNTRAGRGAVLPSGWERRSVRLAADYALSGRGELRLAIEAYYRPENAARRARDRLDLAALRPPACSLSLDALGVLESVTNTLADPHCAWPKTGLELAALGRLALLGDGDHIRAAVYTAVDYLMVSSTVAGFVRDDWPALTADLLSWEAEAGRGDLAAALIGYRAAREVHAQEVRARRLGRSIEADELTLRRAALVALLEEAAAALDARRLRWWNPALRVEAKSLRAVLVKLRTDAVNTGSFQALADVEERARPRLVAVDELHGRVEDVHAAAVAEKAARELESRQAVDARRQQQRAAKEWQALHRAQLDAADKARRVKRKAIEGKLHRRTTRSDESVLRWLLEEGLVEPKQIALTREVPPPIVATIKHLLSGGTVAKPAPRSEREIRTVYVDWAGKRHLPEHLAAWESPGARAVLLAALDAIDPGRT